MLKKGFKWTVSLIIIVFVYYKFCIRGNNRFTIYHHHGLWLPSSTHNIKFTYYPNFPNLVDDDAINICQMEKDDYFKLLRKQQYRYLIRIDTSKDVIGSMYYIYSDYAKIPDSLITKFPAEFGCKSTTGDALGIRANLIDTNTVEVEFTTDWN
ncbi:MAG TPA: hypothetical protein PKG90_11665 [Chitinophagaceae bacterium]|nr:hypothetical protein [Chitinophagaceae bacterium]HNU15820.1 hypothetical protein [Chitinophagaceae bacterium]